MSAAFLAIVLLNAADLLLTCWGLSLGLIREGNPLMAPLLSTYPAAAGLIKLASPLPYVYLASRLKGQVTWLRQATLGLLAAYAIILFLHLRWIVLFVSQGRYEW